MIYTIASIPEQSGTDKNGNPLKFGFTEEYVDEQGTIVTGTILSIRNTELFDKFVVGVKVQA